MSETVAALPPKQICDAYNAENTPAARVTRLWNDFGDLTITRMAQGAICMADISFRRMEGRQRRRAVVIPARCAGSDAALQHVSRGDIYSVDVAGAHGANSDLIVKREAAPYDLTNLTNNVGPC